jgi:hypothetical protein
MRVIYFRFFNEILIIAGLSRVDQFLHDWLLLLGRLKHGGVVTFAIGAFLPRKDQALHLRLQDILLPQLLVEEFGDVGVIN